MSEPREERHAQEPERAPMDAMIDEARVRSAPRRALATDQEVAEARAEIVAWRAGHSLTIQQLARSARVPASTVGQFLRDEYNGDNARIAQQLLACIASYDDQRRRRVEVPFVRTRVAQEIWAVVKAIVAQNAIGMITGPSGLGKTLAIEAVISNDFPMGLRVEIHDGNKTLLELYRALIFAHRRGSGASKGSRVRAGNMGVRRICDAFNHLVSVLHDTDRPIVVDEAENLPNGSLNGLRQLHDATGCPVILIGRPPLRNRVLATADDPAIGGSFLGRVMIDRQITGEYAGRDGGKALYSVDEIVAMLQGMEVRFTPDAARWLCALANLTVYDAGREAGGLRYMVMTLKLAVQMAGGGGDGGDPLTVQLLKQAHTLLRGDAWGQAIDQAAADQPEGRRRTA